MKLLNLQDKKVTPLSPQDTTMPFEEWQSGDAADALALPHDLDLASVDLDFSKVKRLDLFFPIYRDGRAFTQARLLRTRHNFIGDIRATGDVLRDQFLFMVRCGFESFILTPEQDEHGFLESLAEYDHFYQTSADKAQPVWQLRIAQQKLVGAA